MSKKEIIFSLVILISVSVFARDLVGAASNAKQQIILIGGAVTGIAVIAGGILMSLGFAQKGQQLIIGGIIGTAIILGYGAITGALQQMFS